MVGPLEITDIINGDFPQSAIKLAKKMGKAIEKFDMLSKSKIVLLGISGGKDSLTMALLSAIQRDIFPMDIEPIAAMVEWKEIPFSKDQIMSLENFFHVLKIPFTIIPASIYNHHNKESYTCYTCARNRKLTLFQYAKDHNIRNIAFGHHLDDIAETSLMNLIHRGKFDTMQVVQDFFNGELDVLRPMALIKEREIINLHHKINFPVVELNCSKKEKNPRSEYKKIVTQLGKMEPHVREHIFNAHFFKV